MPNEGFELDDDGAGTGGGIDDGGGGGGSDGPLPRRGQTRKLELIASALNNPIPLAYGRHIVGGNVIFQNANNIPYETYTPDDTVVWMIALGEGEWDALETLWINGAEYNVADTTKIHFHPGLDGELGTETDPSTRNQKVCSFYPDNFRPRLTFPRMAYLVLRLPPDKEAPDGVMDVRGIYKTRRVRIFDGSGIQTAYEYSANPAWCILDLLISRAIKPYSLINEALTAGEKAKINFASFAAAAAICAADPGDGAALFECHVVFTDSTDMMRALDQMLMLCRGYLIDRNGEISLYVDGTRSSSFTANRDNIAVGSMTHPRKDLRALANKFNLAYRSLNSGAGDEAKDFQFVTVEVEDHEHQDAIGRIIPADFDIGNSTPGRAARIGEYLRDRSLLNVGQIGCTLLQCGDGNNPIDLLPGDLLTAPEDVDAWFGHVFEILEITDEPDGSRVVSGQSYSADVYHSTLQSRIEIYPPQPERLPLNPTGASGLTFETNASDDSIPPGCLVAKFNRETAHYDTITGVALLLTAAAEAEGPYAVERAAHPTCVIESGSCSVVKDNPDIIVTRSANTAVVGRVLLIYNTDGDLDGNVIESQAANKLRVNPAFNKGGGFYYAIVKRWWEAEDSDNPFYRWIPMEQIGERESLVWRTPAIPYPVGTFYATLYSRNLYGVGTRLTYGPITFADLGTSLDNVLPGAPDEFTVTTPAGRSTGLFLFSWKIPATGNKSLIDYCIQWDTVATFDSGNAVIRGTGHWALYDQLFDPNKTFYFRIAARNKAAIGSNGVVKGLLDAISYPATTNGWGPFCSYIGPRTSLMIFDYATRQVRAQDLGVAIASAVNLAGSARSQHGIFMESWEDSFDGWTLEDGNAPTFLSTGGRTGAKVLRAAGHSVFLLTTMLPWDDSKLARFRIRLRMHAVTEAASTFIWVSLRCYDGAGTYIGEIYTTCQALQGSTLTIDQWYEYTGYIKGAGTPGGTVHPLATDPEVVNTGTVYVRPLVYLNHYPSGPVGNVIDVDYLSIDASDEGATHRSYAGLDSSGDLNRDIKSTTKLSGRSESLTTTLGRLAADGKLGSPDDIAGDGSTYVRTTVNQGAGATRAYAGLNSDGDVARAVPVAQLTAAVRIQTFYQNGAPTAVNVGDIWYDTDDNDRQYRWSGGEWIQVVIKADYVVASISITSPTITGGTIQTATGTGERFVITGTSAVQYNSSNVPVFSSLSSGSTDILHLTSNEIHVVGDLYAQKGIFEYKVISSGATVLLYADAYYSGGVKVLGNQGAAVADATDAASVILRLNELLARLRTHGSIAT